MASQAEIMLYSTTKLIARREDADYQVGTGFFYHVESKQGAHAVCLVTNSHVIKDADEIKFTLNVVDNSATPPVPSGETVTATWKIEAALTIAHPSADLSLMVVSGLFNTFSQIGKPVYYANLTKADLFSAADWATLDGVENVVMAGCPNGLFDDVNALPILRSGRTASHPGKPYKGNSEFLVDLACFPGSSGSPVFHYRPGNMYVDGPSDVLVFKETPLRPMGILYAGPMVTPMHLGIVIRSTELLALDAAVCGLFDLQGGAK